MENNLGTSLLFDVPVSLYPLQPSTELCYKTGERQSKKEPHNSNSLPASLASHTTEISIQEPPLHIQSTDWNSISVLFVGTQKETSLYFIIHNTC